MILHDLFLTERLFGHSVRSLHQKLLDRGWLPTTVPYEYRHPDVTGYSIDLDVYHDNPFLLFRGSQQIAELEFPPYASHLRLHSEPATAH